MRPKLFTLFAAVLLAAALTAGPASAGDPGRESTPPPAGTPTEAATDGREAVLVGIAQVTTGDYHSCARLANNQARCWGLNDEGQLGNNTTDDSPTAVVVKNVTGPGPLQNVVQVAAGEYHSCALLANGQVRCWGYNSSGQLGDGTNDDSERPVVVRNAGDTGPLLNVRAITAETGGTCALLTSDQIRCWGEDDYGQLGNGAPAADTNLPVTVKGLGGTGALTGVRSIEGGYDNNCAVLSNGQARCWGYNGGALGNGDEADVFHPVVVKNIAGGGALTGVTQISQGGYHACVRLANGQARCWGDNEDGQLGNGGNTDTELPVVVRRVGGGALTGVVSVFAADDTTCAQVTGGQARCWGFDTSGENGDGTIGSPDGRKIPTPVRNLTNTGNLTGITQLHMQDAHACVRLSNGEARCWGANDYGQLGNGGTVDRPIPVRVQI